MDFLTQIGLVDALLLGLPNQSIHDKKFFYHSSWPCLALPSRHPSIVALAMKAEDDFVPGELEKLCMEDDEDDLAALVAAARDDGEDDVARRFKEQQMLDEAVMMAQDLNRARMENPLSGGAAEAANEASAREIDRAAKKRIKLSAPGLKIFDEKRCFRYFKAEELSLEEHFGYDKSRRQALKRMGLKEDVVDKIFSDLLTFTLYLSPDAQSALVDGQEDLKAICDYLFYAASSCDDRLVQEKLHTSLLDLLRNYAGKWQLTLVHLLTALENLGADMRAARDLNHLKEMFDSRLKVVGEAKKGKVRFSSPNVAAFLIHMGDVRREASSADRLFMRRAFFSLTKDVVQSHMSESTEFKTKEYDNWTPLLQLVHLLFLAASDVDLIGDPFICEAVSRITHWTVELFYYRLVNLVLTEFLVSCRSVPSIRTNGWGRKVTPASCRPRPEVQSTRRRAMHAATSPRCSAVWVLSRWTRSRRGMRTNSQ